MTITILSSREFNQDAGKAKRAAESGPVIITDRGRPAHVLLTFDSYKQLSQGHSRIADLLAMPWPEGLELDIPQLADPAQAADLA